MSPKLKTKSDRRLSVVVGVKILVAISESTICGVQGILRYTTSLWSARGRLVHCALFRTTGKVYADLRMEQGAPYLRINGFFLGFGEVQTVHDVHSTELQQLFATNKYLPYRRPCRGS